MKTKQNKEYQVLLDGKVIATFNSEVSALNFIKKEVKNKKEKEEKQSSSAVNDLYTSIERALSVSYEYELREVISKPLAWFDKKSEQMVKPL